MASRRMLPFALAIAFVLAGEAPAWAATFKLTVVAASPPTVTPTQITKEFFVPEVTKRVEAAGKGDKIEWVEAYSQTLAKFTELLETVEEGVAHVGVQLKVFEEAKLPLEQYAAMLPFGPANMAKMLEIDRKVRARVPEMNAQWAKYNQIVLSNASEVSMQMFTTFPLTKVADLNGRKIGSSGANGHLLRSTGAVVVTANMMGAYTDITNGVYEGYTVAESLAFPYKIYQAAPYFTRTDFGCIVAASLTFNRKTWDSLPEYIRKILSDVALEWEERYVTVSEGKQRAVIGLMEKAGMKSAVLPEAERKKWAMMMPNIPKEWASAVDKQGLPATKVLTAFMYEFRASGLPVIRNWDKE